MAAHHRDRQPLDAVEIGVDRRDAARSPAPRSVSCSNSRTSAPTMKPFSLPEMKTRPRIDLSRAPCSTRSTMAPSSSSGAPAERVLALALAVEHRPGDALADRWRSASPSGQQRSSCHDRRHASPLGSLHWLPRRSRIGRRALCARALCQLSSAACTSAGSKWSTAMTRAVSCLDLAQQLRLARR